MTEQNLHKFHEYGRTNERKVYHQEVIFSHAEDIYRGMINNISLGGAHIEAINDGKFLQGDIVGDIVTVCIPFTSGDKTVRRKARIVRRDNRGFAIEFMN